MKTNPIKEPKKIQSKQWNIALIPVLHLKVTMRPSIIEYVLITHGTLKTSPNTSFSGIHCYKMSMFTTSVIYYSMEVESSTNYEILISAQVRN